MLLAAACSEEGSEAVEDADVVAWSSSRAEAALESPHRHDSETCGLSCSENIATFSDAIQANGPVTIGSLPPNLQPLFVYGTITANGGLTNDFRIDPNGISFIDSVVGSSAHGSGTDETLAVGWTGSPELRGQLDVRTNHNTISCKDSGAGYFEASDTIDTGDAPRASYGLRVEQVSGRGSGTAPLTTYGVFVDNPGNGQENYAVYAERGDIATKAGSFKGNAALTALGYATESCNASASPPTLTGGTITNNWDVMAELAPTCRIRVSSTSSDETVITGIANPSLPNTRIWILDNAGNGPITFKHNSPSSFFGNRFYLENDADVVIDEFEIAYLIRDPSLSAWRIIGGHPRVAANTILKSTISLGVGASGVVDDGTTVSTNEGIAAKTIRTGGTSGPVWSSGAGVPTGNCNTGDLYSNTQGELNTTLYVCTGTNKWTAR